MTNDKLHYAESILSAAIFVGGVIHSIPQPGRHHHIIDKMVVNGMKPWQWSSNDQGFLTSTGRFVNRFEAMNIAKNSGQLLGKSPTVENELFSEDLW